MYPDGFATFVEVQSEMPRQLCGKTRPIHFPRRVHGRFKLFNIVTPDKAFFGQKDAQQLAIIRRMVLDLSMGIEIVGCPIIREADGLAKSSRNTYLSAEERKAALVLSRAVKARPGAGPERREKRGCNRQCHACAYRAGAARAY